MIKDEFIKTAARSGYCTKKEAEMYCGKNPKDVYTDDDYIEVYRFVRDRNHISRGQPLYGGGTTSKRYVLDD